MKNLDFNNKLNTMKYIKYFLIAIIIATSFSAQTSSAQQVTGTCMYSQTAACSDGTVSKDASNCSSQITSTAPCCLSDNGDGSAYIAKDSGVCTDGFTKTSMDKCTAHPCCCSTPQNQNTCALKCCANPADCVDQNNFCNSLVGAGKVGTYDGLGCAADKSTPCGTGNGLSGTAVCCCTRDLGANENGQITPVVSQGSVPSLNFTPEVGIPGATSVFKAGTAIPVGKSLETNSNGIKTTTMSSDLLAKYIQAVYNYGLAIAAILAAIVLMGGGLLWLSSGGDSGRVTKAKEMIIGAITGLVILFCAWIILNTINPDLLKLKPIETVIVNKINYCCNPETGNVLLDPTTKKCPAASPMCDSGSSCTTMTTDNKFGCIKQSDYNCCEFQHVDQKRTKCIPVKTSEKCVAPQGYKLRTTDTGKYCEQKVYEGTDSCIDSCAGKSNGDTCPAPPSTICRCFNELAFYGSSLKAGDYCGNRDSKTSKCYTKTCDELGLKADHVMNFNTIAAINPLYDYYQLFFGTDDCGKSLHCCGK